MTCFARLLIAPLMTCALLAGPSLAQDTFVLTSPAFADGSDL